MPVPLIPESAPFTPKQRAWLNGFFAGLLNVDPEALAASGMDPGGGQAHAAGQLNGHGGGQAVAEAEPEDDEEDHPWHDPGLSLEERLELAEGKPLRLRLMAAMAQLDCGACGYLCESYSQAIADGSETDLTRCVPGAKETARTLKKIVKDEAAELTVNGRQLSDDAAETAVQEAPAGYDREQPVQARVAVVESLNGPDSAKDTRFVRLDLSDSGLSYEVGDSLGVWPENCPQLVQQILDTLGLDPQALVPAPTGGEAPVVDVLSRQVSITEAEDELLECLIAATNEVGEQEDLQKMLDSGAEEGCDLLELLEAFPSARPDAASLIASLPRIKPRLYSISSSLKAVPNHVDLTVGTVRYERDGRPRKGLASCFLADRCSPGQTVRVYVQKSHGFGLPDDGQTPLIMVGPGTGIAPFRAFLQERKALGHPGKNWLFFGDQREACDFLYRQELEGWHHDGLLTRLDTAFSRDGAEKVYVQHRMLEHAEELGRWLSEGAHIRVCGDAKRMAKDVDDVLRQIVAQAEGLSEDQAKQRITELTKQGRYQRDVY